MISTLHGGPTKARLAMQPSLLVGSPMTLFALMSHSSCTFPFIERCQPCMASSVSVLPRPPPPHLAQLHFLSPGSGPFSVSDVDLRVVIWKRVVVPEMRSSRSASPWPSAAVLLAFGCGRSCLGICIRAERVGGMLCPEWKVAPCWAVCVLLAGVPISQFVHIFAPIPCHPVPSKDTPITSPALSGNQALHMSRVWPVGPSPRLVAYRRVATRPALCRCAPPSTHVDGVCRQIRMPHVLPDVLGRPGMGGGGLYCSLAAQHVVKLFLRAGRVAASVRVVCAQHLSVHWG